MSIKQTLLDRLKNRQATVGIVGLGYVGLPLEDRFSAESVKVICVSLKATKVNTDKRAQN